MARKQSDYLADILSEEKLASSHTPASDDSIAVPARQERLRGSTLLGRENALARVATGEVRQVTQLLLDPARVRVWPGNARSYAHLSEESCRDLIDSIIAENGQKVPAIVRRIEASESYDYEVIAGTRRHWAISWLRANSYPDIPFIAQVVSLDDEAAFRLADIENRARKDVSDLERARNYAAALKTHYDNHLTRMAERLKLSKGWLSKMLKVSTIPDEIIAAFASPADVQLKPGYALAQALDDKEAFKRIRRAATEIASEQEGLRERGTTLLPAATVLQRLLSAPKDTTKIEEPLVVTSAHGRPMLSVTSVNRQGVTIRLHSGSGARRKDLLEALDGVLSRLDERGRGLKC